MSSHFDNVFGDEREVSAKVTVVETLLSGTPDLHGNHCAGGCTGPQVLLRVHSVVGEVAVQEIDRELVDIIPAGILADSLGVSRGGKGVRWGKREALHCVGLLFYNHIFK